MPVAVVEKLQMSSANCMEGTGRSWGWGRSQLERKANIRSAINRLHRRGERGSPWRRPTIDEKDWPNLDPSLTLEVVLM